MQKIVSYFQEAYDELLNKVTWPTWGELQESSVVVLITSLIISFVVLGMDLSFKAATQQLYKLIIG